MPSSDALPDLTTNEGDVGESANGPPSEAPSNLKEQQDAPPESLPDLKDQDDSPPEPPSDQKGQDDVSSEPSLDQKTQDDSPSEQPSDRKELGHLSEQLSEVKEREDTPQERLHSESEERQESAEEMDGAGSPGSSPDEAKLTDSSASTPATDVDEVVLLPARSGIISSTSEAVAEVLQSDVPMQSDVPSDELSELSDPAVYDATRSMVNTVLTRAAELLDEGVLEDITASPDAIVAASELLRRVMTVARRQVEAAAVAMHRILPLGIRLCEQVMTVDEWRRVEHRSKLLAQRLIYRAFTELSLTPLQQESRQLLRRLRRRPPLLWAQLSLAEVECELRERRPPDDYPGRDEDRDVASLAECALLKAYRAAVRNRLAEPVPKVDIRLTVSELVDDGCGLSMIHDVVRTWRYSVKWRYCVDFLRTENERLRAHHFYQVRFSIPELHQPVPKAVAYVFFRLTASKVHSIYTPIEVSYQTETSRLRHVPGKSIFQEKWLVDIVNAKLKLWREIKF